MTALASLNAPTDPALALSLQRQRTPAGYQVIARTAGPATVAAFSSGYPEFDRILDRLNTAFGKLAHVDDTDDEPTDAVDDLAASLRSVTGRGTTAALTDPAGLATQLQQSLAAHSRPLTDPTAQSLLRAL